MTTAAARTRFRIVQGDSPSSRRPAAPAEPPGALEFATTPTSSGGVATPSGMVLDGSQDKLESPRTKSDADDVDQDGVSNEIPTSLVDFMEFYLLN